MRRKASKLLDFRNEIKNRMKTNFETFKIDGELKGFSLGPVNRPLSTGKRLVKKNIHFMS